ncbi:hypothetical protein AGMMS49573_07920 [Endomicrobiia bacterium]|nr:hypothetical protein AGMMS49573_07920 [Endomicrobiia bacterium]
MGYRGLKGLKGVKPIVKSGAGGSGTVRGFNNDGTFVRRHNWTLDASRGYTVDAEPMDDEFDNYAEALNNCITRDGTGKPTNNLDFAGWQINNIGANWSNPASAVTLTQLVNQTLPIFYGTPADNDAGTVITLDVLKSAQKVLPNEQTNRGYLFILVLNANVQNSSQYLKMQYAGNIPDISTYQIRWMDGGTFPAGTLVGGLPYLVFFRTAAIYIAPLAGGSNSGGGGGGGGGGIQTLRSRHNSIMIDASEDILNPYIDADIQITTETPELLHIAAIYGTNNMRGSVFVINNKYKLSSASEQIVVESVQETPAQQQVRFNPNFYSNDGTIAIQQLTKPNEGINFYSGYQFTSTTGSIHVSVGGATNNPNDKNIVNINSDVILGNYVNQDNSVDNSLIIDNTDGRVLKAKVNQSVLPQPSPSTEIGWTHWTISRAIVATGVGQSLGIIKGTLEKSKTLADKNLRFRVFTTTQIHLNGEWYNTVNTLEFWLSFTSEGLVKPNDYGLPQNFGATRWQITGTHGNGEINKNPTGFCMTVNNSIRWGVFDDLKTWAITAHTNSYKNTGFDDVTGGNVKIMVQATNDIVLDALKNNIFSWDVDSTYNEGDMTSYKEFNDGF